MLSVLYKKALLRKALSPVITIYNVLLFLALLFIIQPMQAQVTIGSGIEPDPGALLDLKEKQPDAGNSTAGKGVNFPRVRLANINNLFPMFEDDGAGGYRIDTKSYVKALEDARHTGLTVYNIASGQGFSPGFYFWDGERWKKMVTEIPPVAGVQIGLTELSANTLTLTGNNQGGGGTFLSFGNSIQIPEDGSYAFSLRLYGLVNDLPAVGTSARCVYYISLWANNGSTDELRDIAEINLYAGKVNSSFDPNYTYSITIGSGFKKGETVKIKISCLSNPWNLISGDRSKANRTSLLWWRL